MNNNESRVTGPLVDSLPRKLGLVAAAALIIAAFYFKSHSHHFFFSYLTSFYFFTTISLGALFFVLLQHVSAAGWSVTVRRIPELIMSNIAPLSICFIPLLFGLHDLYHWTHLDAVQHDHLLAAKSPYLNVQFFYVRLFIYWGIWIFLTKAFYMRSIEQDITGDQALTKKSRKQATYGIVLFGLTVTFSAFDWIMSLEPHWFSTIFGVYMFAGAMVSGLSVISLVAMVLRKNGFLTKEITIEHFHDLGKLIYGFNIFWAYIAFSQYFLIWYANIPEETFWFHLHFTGSWQWVAALLAIGHFGIPFIFFMSRHAKRNLKVHAIMAIWLCGMHFLDLYWVIMPTFLKTGASFGIGDLALLVGLGSLFFMWIFRRMKSVSIYPIKDPLLHEAKRFENY